MHAELRSSPARPISVGATKIGGGQQPERFPTRSQEALATARVHGGGRRHSQVLPEQLSALVGQDEGILLPVLHKLATNAGAVRADVDAALDALPTLPATAEPTTSSEPRGVLRAAEAELAGLGDAFISVEHLLLSLRSTASAATSPRPPATAGLTR